MSIEQALADNTAAIAENTAVLKATLAHLSGGTPAPAAAATPAEAPAKATRKKADKAEKTEPAAPAINAKTVADAVVDIANTVSRDAAVSLLKEFGAERASGLKPEQYALVLARAAEIKAPAPADDDSLV